MNTVRKGRQVEKEVCKVLDTLGYDTYRPTWNRWGTKDIFGTFDILAAHRREDFVELFPPLLLLQVKSNRNDFAAAKRKVREWYKAHALMLGVGLGAVLKKRQGFLFWVVQKGKVLQKEVGN